MDKLFSVTDIASALDEIDKCKYCKDAKCTNICPFKVDIKKILELPYWKEVKYRGGYAARHIMI